MAVRGSFPHLTQHQASPPVSPTISQNPQGFSTPPQHHASAMVSPAISQGIAQNQASHGSPLPTMAPTISQASHSPTAPHSSARTSSGGSSPSGIQQATLGGSLAAAIWNHTAVQNILELHSSLANIDITNTYAIDKPLVAIVEAARRGHVGIVEQHPIGIESKIQLAKDNGNGSLESRSLVLHFLEALIESDSYGNTSV